jgi:3-oxoadipate enol-lactonase
VYRVAMTTLRVDLPGDHCLHGELAGSGERVVTLLHGLASTLATWDEIALALAKTMRVLRFDQRGHGASTVPPGAWTLADLGADVIAALDRCGVARTTLVGHSGGGVVAMHTAIEHPERIDALVLLATASQANKRAALWYEQMACKAETSGGASVLGDFGWHEVSPAPDAVGIAKAARCMATLHRQPLTPLLARIRCPTTIVVGSDDFIGVGGSVIIHKHIAGSRLEIWPGRGHAVHREDPTALLRLLAERA